MTWFLLFNLHFVSEVGFNTASLTRAQLITQQRDFITRWAQILGMKQIHLLKSLVFNFTWKFNACFNFYDGSLLEGCICVYYGPIYVLGSSKHIGINKEKFVMQCLFFLIRNNQ